MIADYYLVDSDGYTKERFRLHEDDKFIEFKKLIKGPNAELSTPRYDFQTKSWVEALEPNIFLEEVKLKKRSDLKDECYQKIVDGFDVEVGGKNLHFNYQIEHQQNLTDTVRLFENNMIDKIGWNAYVGEEKKRIQLNKEDFTRVYLAGVKHKTDCLTRLNDVLYPLVNAAENKETIARIYWDTGLPASELSLKEGQAIEDRMKELKNKDGELENADMMTMMALMQMSMRIP